MKRLFYGFLISVLCITQCFGATGWLKTKPASGESPSDISTLVGENNAAVDLMLSTYSNCKLSYATAATLTVSSGGVMVSNSGGTVRLMLANTSDTTVTWADIDADSEEASTTYYIYAIGSATTDTTFTIKISKNSSAPSGVTYYKRIGSFYNDSSSNIVSIKTDNQTVSYYDSGWFSVAANSSYTKVHNLGTQKLLIFVYFSTTNDGSNVDRAQTYDIAYSAGYNIKDITTTQMTIATGASHLQIDLPPSGTWIETGYYKIIVVSLE